MGTVSSHINCVNTRVLFSLQQLFICIDTQLPLSAWFANPSIVLYLNSLLHLYLFLCSIIEFWSQKSIIEKYPFLAAAAMVILAVPCTQCSVERLFSILKLMLTNRRFRLAGEAVNANMCIGMNFEFLDRLKLIVYE